MRSQNTQYAEFTVKKRKEVLIMSFKDIFKSSFLENMASASVFDIVLALALALLMGLFIYFVYKKSFKGVMYSQTFGITLVTMTLISTFVILAVTSNVVLSLGMVGALSIVRFRTAIKEPLDIAFLFWAIAAGIVLAAGMIPLAVIGSLLIGVMIVILTNRKTVETPYMLIMKYADNAGENNAASFIERCVKRAVIKSKTVTKDLTEVNYEVRLIDDNTDFINTLTTMDGVQSAVMVSYNGEYMS